MEKIIIRALGGKGYIAGLDSPIILIYIKNVEVIPLPTFVKLFIRAKTDALLHGFQVDFCISLQASVVETLLPSDRVPLEMGGL